jgi:hypothetical protein
MLGLFTPFNFWSARQVSGLPQNINAIVVTSDLQGVVNQGDYNCGIETQNLAFAILIELLYFSSTEVFRNQPNANPCQSNYILVQHLTINEKILHVSR